MKCTTCQSEIVPGARVCKACGHPVTLNPSLEDLYFSRLSANAPPAFVQKVRSAPYLAKERRMVTAVLFTVANVDMFTEHVPEEERTPILNQALERFAGIIFQYEGTIAKLWENTVLAFFGAPISHEDDPLRAVNAALAILDDVKEISAEVEGKYGIPFQLHMVVNTGPIVIGEIKSNLKFDFHSLNYTLECMDLAIREDIPRCQVILFDDTYRYIKPFVECVKLDEIQCTEIEMDLHLWQLTHITHAPNNVSRQQLTSKSIMIGR
jgi:class 3 adenylate cyclase